MYYRYHYSIPIAFCKVGIVNFFPTVLTNQTKYATIEAQGSIPCRIRDAHMERSTDTVKRASITLIFMLLFSFLGCTKSQYSESDFIGLTSKEIVEKYGDFDHRRSNPSDDGLYRNCGCGYMVKEAKVGFLGTTPPEYFMVYFDGEGIAYRCAYEEGGIGG